MIVSHSAALAGGVAELARAMAGPGVAIETAGGTELPDDPLGTDAALVMRAIEQADSGDGVLVLMDLGSAVLSAEMALDMLPEEVRDHVLLCDAPLVEGAVSAATAARLGRPLNEVAAEARSGLEPKSAHLAEAGEPEGEASPGGGEAKLPAEPSGPGPAAQRAGEEAMRLRLTVTNRLGLHARPAALFVRTAAGFDAPIEVTNLSAGRGPASARSLNAVATLGVRQGHEIEVVARGPDASAALDALRELAERGFGDEAQAAPGIGGAPTSAATEIAGAPLVQPGEIEPGSALQGLAASPGSALGPARHLRGRVPSQANPGREAAAGPEGDPGTRWAALTQAIDKARRDIERARGVTQARAGSYEASIFDAHLLLLDDEALLTPARRAILEEGRDAAPAWRDAVEEVVASYRALEDDYQRSRAEDVEDVGARVLAHLLGEPTEARLTGPGVVVARRLGPADAVLLDPAQVRGIATALGGPLSHGAILARSLGVPAVVGLGERVLALPEGTEVLLDGDAGLIVVEPSSQQREQHRRRAERAAQARREALAAAGDPAVTVDGRRVHVMANAASLEDAAGAPAAGADGIGLLRTEFLFLERASAPGEEEQYLTYRKMAEALEGRPLVVRTLDAGADKPLGYLPRALEENPFLGERGIRNSQAHPELIREQLRAVLRAAAERPVKVMFPMVTGVDELRRAKDILAAARRDLAERDLPFPQAIEVGAMVEVPALALAARRVASEVDFFSIGTNDLTQYALAVDRGNERVAAMADALHPAVLALIDAVVAAARPAGRWVGVCGEAAGDPIAVPVLVGLGVAELSMNAPAIPIVKRLIRSLDVTVAEAVARRALELGSAAEVRDLIAAELAGEATSW